MIDCACARRGACGKKKPPVARPTAAAAADGSRPRPPVHLRRPEPVPETPPIPPEPTITRRSARRAATSTSSTRTRRSSRCSSRSTAPRSTSAGQQALNTNADDPARSTRRGSSPSRGTATSAAPPNTISRSARSGRWRPRPTSCRSAIPDGSAAHRQLRQGISLRSGPRRSRVVEEPPRALRRHEQVGSGDWYICRLGDLTMRMTIARTSLLARLDRRRLARRRPRPPTRNICS